MSNKKRLKQTFSYNGKEYSYRIQAANIRRMERETGMNFDELNIHSRECKFILLYYCTCWNGEFVTLDSFVSDCKTGRVSFRVGFREYAGIGLGNLFFKKVQELKRRGEL